MATSDERMKILTMIGENKISAEEGARLLQALQQGSKRNADERPRDPRWLRVKVTDTRLNKPKVNINLPMSLVNVGIKLGARFIPADKEADFAGVLQAIRSGATGKVFEYEDRDDAEKVEIWVE
jgi:hypothetical protein